MSAADYQRVAGFCPMGCGPTLFLGTGNNVTCSSLDCSAPGAVDELLHDRETEHIVVIREHDFTVQHPVRERVTGELMDCELHRFLASLDGPPRRPGRYRAMPTMPGGISWRFLRIEEAAA